MVQWCTGTRKLRLFCMFSYRLCLHTTRIFCCQGREYVPFTLDNKKTETDFLRKCVTRNLSCFSCSRKIHSGGRTLYIYIIIYVLNVFYTKICTPSSTKQTLDFTRFLDFLKKSFSYPKKSFSYPKKEF